MHIKNQRISTVILFTTLIMTSGITACSRSEDSPSGSSAGGAAGRSSTGPGGAGAGASDAANASGGGGGSEGTGGASSGATSDAMAGGQSFDGSAGANTGSSKGRRGRRVKHDGWFVRGRCGRRPLALPLRHHQTPDHDRRRFDFCGPRVLQKYLLQYLTDNHYSKFQFVGEYSDDCGGVVRHSAVSCSTAEQYTQPTFMMSNCSVGTTFKGLSGLMTSQSPDMVMLQLGVNDVWGGKSVSAILASYTTLVQQARAANPAVVLAVARIQKIRPNCGDDATLTNQAQALESAVPAWAQQLSTATSPIFTADLWTNSDWSMAETIDCVHPNDVGAKKMGMNWYNALKTILTPD